MISRFLIALLAALLATLELGCSNKGHTDADGGARVDAARFDAGPLIERNYTRCDTCASGVCLGTPDSMGATGKACAPPCGRGIFECPPPSEGSAAVTCIPAANLGLTGTMSSAYCGLVCEGATCPTGMACEANSMLGPICVWPAPGVDAAPPPMRDAGERPDTGEPIDAGPPATGHIDQLDVGGGGHGCVLRSGAVACWGNNAAGQLGDGTMMTRATLGPVMGLPPGITAIATGENHTCALTASGGVKCWGDNSNGQLGDGTISPSPTPLDVVGISGATAIAAGWTHTCAIVAGGAVKCWGGNFFGQLGNSEMFMDHYMPVDVMGLTGATRIEAGKTHTCAIVAGGAAKCWGSDGDGECGNDSISPALVPVDVMGLTGITQISGGNAYSCAVTGGAGKCWGMGLFGELGTGSNAEVHVPTDVSGLGSGVAEIAAGYGNTCARMASGAVKCWGMASMGTMNSNVPIDVAGLSGVAAIAAGNGFTCAATSDDRILCWSGGGAPTEVM